MGRHKLSLHEAVHLVRGQADEAYNLLYPKEEPMQPTIGRIVHYVNHNDDHCPAIVTHVTDVGVVNLVVFNPYITDCTMPAFGVGNDESGEKHGTWHWPERD